MDAIHSCLRSYIRPLCDEWFILEESDIDFQLSRFKAVLKNVKIRPKNVNEFLSATSTGLCLQDSDISEITFELGSNKLQSISFSGLSLEFKLNGNDSFMETSNQFDTGNQPLSNNVSFDDFVNVGEESRSDVTMTVRLLIEWIYEKFLSNAKLSLTDTHIIIVGYEENSTRYSPCVELNLKKLNLDLLQMENDLKNVDVTLEGLSISAAEFDLTDSSHSSSSGNSVMELRSSNEGVSSIASSSGESPGDTVVMCSKRISAQLALSTSSMELQMNIEPVVIFASTTHLDIFTRLLTFQHNIHAPYQLVNSQEYKDESFVMNWHSKLSLERLIVVLSGTERDRNLRKRTQVFETLEKEGYAINVLTKIFVENCYHQAWVVAEVKGVVCESASMRELTVDQFQLSLVNKDFTQFFASNAQSPTEKALVISQNVERGIFRAKLSTVQMKLTPTVIRLLQQHLASLEAFTDRISSRDYMDDFNDRNICIEKHIEISSLEISLKSEVDLSAINICPRDEMTTEIRLTVTNVVVAISEEISVQCRQITCYNVEDRDIVDKLFSFMPSESNPLLQATIKYRSETTEGARPAMWSAFTGGHSARIFTYMSHGHENVICPTTREEMSNSANECLQFSRLAVCLWISKAQLIIKSYKSISRITSLVNSVIAATEERVDAHPIFHTDDQLERYSMNQFDGGDVHGEFQQTPTTDSSSPLQPLHIADDNVLFVEDLQDDKTLVNQVCRKARRTPDAHDVVANSLSVSLSVGVIDIYLGQSSECNLSSESVELFFCNSDDGHIRAHALSGAVLIKIADTVVAKPSSVDSRCTDCLKVAFDRCSSSTVEDALTLVALSLDGMQISSASVAQELERLNGLIEDFGMDRASATERHEKTMNVKCGLSVTKTEIVETIDRFLDVAPGSEEQLRICLQDTYASYRSLPSDDLFSLELALDDVEVSWKHKQKTGLLAKLQGVGSKVLIYPAADITREFSAVYNVIVNCGTFELSVTRSNLDWIKFILLRIKIRQTSDVSLPPLDEMSQEGLHELLNELDPSIAVNEMHSVQLTAREDGPKNDTSDDSSSANFEIIEDVKHGTPMIRMRLEYSEESNETIREPVCQEWTEDGCLWSLAPNQSFKFVGKSLAMRLRLQNSNKEVVLRLQDLCGVYNEPVADNILRSASMWQLKKAEIHIGPTLVLEQAKLAHSVRQTPQLVIRMRETNIGKSSMMISLHPLELKMDQESLEVIESLELLWNAEKCPGPRQQSTRVVNAYDGCINSRDFVFCPPTFVTLNYQGQFRMEEWNASPSVWAKSICQLSKLKVPLSYVRSSECETISEFMQVCGTEWKEAIRVENQLSASTILNSIAPVRTVTDAMVSSGMVRTAEKTAAVAQMLAEQAYTTMSNAVNEYGPYWSSYIWRTSEAHSSVPVVDGIAGASAPVDEADDTICSTPINQLEGDMSDSMYPGLD